MVNEPDQERPYAVVIRRNRDGVVRKVQTGGFWSRFWFEDGNGACDCNRGKMFAEAGGEEDPNEDCGDDAYTILKYLFSDGSELHGDGS